MMMKKTSNIGCPSFTLLHSTLQKEHRYFIHDYNRCTQIDDNERKISKSESSILEI